MVTRKQFLLKQFESGEERKIFNVPRGASKPYIFMTMREKYLHNDIRKIGYLDLETSGLSADFDFIITWAMLVRDVKTGKTTIRKDRISIKDWNNARRKKDADLIDERILQSLMSSISDIDYLVGHWFIGPHRHDIPFTRSRIAINEVSGFPKHKMIRFGDTQKWSRIIHRLRNNGLATIADAYSLSTHKTEVKTKHWKNAAMFCDKKSIDYIMDHNIKDVIITYKVHKRIEQYVPISGIFY